MINNKICAVIITYNIDIKIIGVIEAVINQVETIIIVDNASQNKTVEILKSLQKYEKVNIIFNEQNVGIAKALNQGIEFAETGKYDWILTLDHDSICENNMVKNMLEYKKYLNCEQVKMIVPQVFEINKNDFISNRSDKSVKYFEVKDCIQSGAIIKTSVFKKVGYFNEELFIYHVDFDFCQRLLKNKYKIIQCNLATIYHEEGYKISRKILGMEFYYNNYSEYSIYYITRNTIFMTKNYSIFYIKRIIKDFIHILLFDNKRREKLSYWIRGIKDALINKYGKIEE